MAHLAFSAIQNYIKIIFYISTTLANITVIIKISLQQVEMIRMGDNTCVFKVLPDVVLIIN